MSSWVVWRCRACAAVLGGVRNGELRLGDGADQSLEVNLAVARVYASAYGVVTVQCSACQATRVWIPSRRKATA